MPRQELRLEEIASLVGTSITPVREALARLEAEGLVSYIPHKGVTVAQVDFTDVQEIYLIRESLESLAARMGTGNLSEREIAKLSTLHDRMVEATNSGRLKSLRKLNYDFHMIIYSATNMKRLMKIITTLWTLFPWDTLHVIPGRAQASCSEHDSILKAMRQKDPNAAGTAVTDHIQRASVMLQEHLQKSVKTG